MVGIGDAEMYFVLKCPSEQFGNLLFTCILGDAYISIYLIPPDTDQGLYSLKK